MTRPMRNIALNGYVALVTLAGLVAAAIALARVPRSAPLGPRPIVFVLFATLLTVAEMRPLRWLTGRDGLEITASWTFSLGLLFVAPLGTALLAVAIASSVVELWARKPLNRVLFNTSQVTLSLTGGAAVMSLTRAGAALWSPGGPGVLWLAGSALAGVVAVGLNGVFLAVVLALSQRVPVQTLLKATITADGVMGLLLVGLAPVLTGVAARVVILVPLLLLVVIGVYQSAKVGLEHRHEATHDLLTGLPNRRLFFEQGAVTLNAAKGHDRDLAVMLVDLDGFKGINDRLGHAVGDLVLREVGVRLLKHRRSTDIVARFGGDEFALLFGGIADLEAAERLAASVRHSLREPLQVDGVPVAVDGSVGLAMYPDHGEDIDTLLAHADAAMYRAKSGRLGLQTYDSDRDRYGPTRLGLLGELREAIENDELVLAYQPKVDLRTGAIRGVEALVRWNHPQRGMLMPDTFIPAAEQTELVDELTERVLRLAAAQAVQWRGQGIDLIVAVNTSARNLVQMKFPDVVRRVLAEHRLPADRIELEITENTVTNDPARTEVVLAKLKALGVGLSVDDFGTGYSSLAHLRNLPIDHIKIDRSFVRGLVANRGDFVIVRCIIDLADNLGLGTVAEGVEDEATLQALRAMGCDVAQGYHLGRPGPPAAIERLIAERGLYADPTHLVPVTP